MGVSSKRGTLHQLIAKEREHTAQVLAYVAEVDRRQLHKKLGYPTMVDFCIGKLGMDEAEATERVEVARAALVFPTLFEAIADGRLHLAAVRLLAPHLTAANVHELVAAMTHRPESEISAMLTEWFG